MSRTLETWENIVTTQKEKFGFDTPINLEDKRWMWGLTNLEVYNSVFIIKERNPKFRYLEKKKLKNSYNSTKWSLCRFGRTKVYKKRDSYKIKTGQKGVTIELLL